MGLTFADFAWNGWFYSFCIQFVWMTIMWVCNICQKNGSWTDLGWASGFTWLAIFYLILGDGWWPRKIMICAPYILCGLRFIYGFFLRGHHTGYEDKRYAKIRNDI